MAVRIVDRATVQLPCARWHMEAFASEFRQILVRRAQTRIADRHDNVGAARRQRPGARGMDAARMVHPLAGVEWVRRSLHWKDLPVRFDGIERPRGPQRTR